MIFNKGQSLIETLVGLLIVTIVIVAVVSTIVISIGSGKYAQHKTSAAFLSQEGAEWARTQSRALGWETFSGYASPAGTNYCLDTLAFDEGVCGQLEVIDNIFYRSMTLTEDANPTVDEITSRILVTWSEGSKQFSSEAVSVFTKWDYEN